MALIDTDKITTDNDLIDFLLDRHKETGDGMFLAAANSISLYRRDINLLNFCLGKEWTRLEVEPPEILQEVICYRGNFIGDMMNVYTYLGQGMWKDDYGIINSTEEEGITHWMPLPAPPVK